MTDLVLEAAAKAVKRRGGTNTTINKDSVQREILDAVNDIASIDRLRANPDLVDWKPNKIAAAHLRESRSQFDHAEAAEAGARGTRRTRRGASPKGSWADASRSGTPPTFDPTQTAWPTLESQEGES
jgi:putative transposase